LSDIRNNIKNAELTATQTELKHGDQMRFRIIFNIEGEVRRAFDQRSWERAYNLHDNLFRIKIDIELKSNRKTLAHLSSFHKASLFWTRNPNLPYRIWIFIIKDDATFYPSDVEEARSLLFDVEKELIINTSQFDTNIHEVYAQIRVWWGKHNYTPSCELKAKTNKLSLRIHH
jgi:hypothetical protein